jgi:hypothetical protein
MMAMRRGHPHLWAKRSGDLIGPNSIEPRLAWVLENRRLALRYDRLGLINQSCSRTCLFLIAGALVREF